MIVRLTWASCLFTISLPGLMLWIPVFLTTFYAVHNFKKAGAHCITLFCTNTSDRLGKCQLRPFDLH